jgi:hypothetical protein
MGKTNKETLQAMVNEVKEWVACSYNERSTTGGFLKGLTTYEDEKFTLWFIIYNDKEAGPSYYIALSNEKDFNDRTRVCPSEPWELVKMTEDLLDIVIDTIFDDVLQNIAFVCGIDIKNGIRRFVTENENKKGIEKYGNK